MEMQPELLGESTVLPGHGRTLNYLDYQVLQEGNIIPEDERLAIMGMPINKSTLPDGIKKKFRNVLLEEVIKSDNIDQVKLMKELVKIEKSI